MTAYEVKLETNLKRVALERDQALRERDSLQAQRDQVLHLLAGGTLTEEQVTESGLGRGVLSEQRHHEYMRTKAEKERDEARACNAEMRGALVHALNDRDATDLATWRESAKRCLSTNCGQPLLARLERYRKAIDVVSLFLEAPGNDALLADAKAACEALKEP